MAAPATAERARAEPATLRAIIGGLRAHGSRTALVDFQSAAPDGQPRTLTYEALADLVERTAVRLRSLGVERGSGVALWGPNAVEWVVAHFAVLSAGAYVVPIDHQTSADTAREQLEHAAPKLLLTTAAHRAELGAHAASLAPIRLIEHGSEADAESLWRDLPATADPSELPPVEPGDVAALLYTSGTTGTPKAVPLTHYNVAANVAALCAQRLIGADDRVLLPLPLHHTYPFTVGLLTSLVKGATVVFPSGLSGSEISRAAQGARATALLAVPRLCEALWDAVSAAVAQRGTRAEKLFHRLLRFSIAVRRLTRLRIGKRLFKPVHERLGPSLDLIGCGGAKLDPKLAWRLEGLGFTVLTGYGLTETSPVLTFNDQRHSRLGTEGRPLPGVALDIRPVAADEGAREPRKAVVGRVEGEIVARGPSVFSGYRDNPEATADAFTQDGWFRTGDLGWVDRAGYLRVVGRSKELIVLADGKKIFPEGLEKVYSASELFREVAVLEQDGKLAALLVPNEQVVRQRGALREATLYREELEEIGARLPPYQRLSAFRVTRSPLPRTQLGKLRRHLLPDIYRAAASAEKPRAPAELAAEDAALLGREPAHSVWKWLEARYPDKHLTLDTSPQLELNIDSLEWVTITIEIEQRFGRVLTSDAVSRILTLRDLLLEVEKAPAPAGPRAEAPAAPAAADVPGPAMRAVGALVFALLRPLVRLLFRVRVEGLERLPEGTPVVIAPNHASFLDPLALAAALPWHRLRKTFWAGWVGILYTNPFTRFLSRATQVMPVDPDRDLAAAIGTARALLREGYSIVWFPEGRRSPTGELGPFFGGIGALLQESGALAVPTAIRGTFEAWPKQRRLPRLAPVTVTFGAPLELREPNPDPRTAVRISTRLHDAVGTLLARRPDNPTQDGNGRQPST